MGRTDQDEELLEAAKQGDLDEVTRLLDKGAAIETEDFEVDDDSAYRSPASCR